MGSVGVCVCVCDDGITVHRIRGKSDRQRRGKKEYEEQTGSYARRSVSGVKKVRLASTRTLS